ncbi:MAG: type II toxin-antitoxin system VapC family toxin [Candidatus Acidiferrum sp.]
MSVSLLDTNVLIALMWPAHEDHARSQAWFRKNAHRGWATCAITQSAFVRIVSNPAFSPDAVTPQAASNLLSNNLRDQHHHFWALDISFDKAAAPFLQQLIGHQQVMDAYLLGLAVHKKGRLVTMDRGIAHLFGAKSDSVELIAAG